MIFFLIFEETSLILTIFLIDVLLFVFIKLLNFFNELSISDFVNQAVNIIEDQSCNLSDFGELLNETWKLKKKLSDRVTNPEIDSLYSRAIEAGATGGKLLGAGGGGFFLFYVKKNN